MQYRLINDPGDHKAYNEARERGENVYLMKIGKGPLVIMNMPEEPKDRWRHSDPETCGEPDWNEDAWEEAWSDDADWADRDQDGAD